MKRGLLLGLFVIAAALVFTGCIVIENPEPIHTPVFTGERVKEDFRELRGIYYQTYSDGTAEVVGINQEVITVNSITIPEKCGRYTVVAVIDQAFRDSFLTEVRLPDNLECIGKRAFQGSALKRISLPDALTEVGEDAFDHCKDLNKVEFGAGLKVLPTGMFFGCDSLQQVVLPEGVEVVGEECFSDCESLEKVVLPDSLREIGAYAFWNSGVEDLAFFIPEGVEAIGAAAFRGTAWLKSQTKEFVVVGDGVLIRYNGWDTEVVIPEGIRYLSDAFAGTKVTKVTLPQSFENECRDAWEESQVQEIIPATNG